MTADLGCLFLAPLYRIGLVRGVFLLSFRSLFWLLARQVFIVQAA
jgi:hypothetical protein